MLKKLTAILAAAMVLTGASSALADPIYVDGSGNIITESAFNQAQQNEGTGIIGPSTGVIGSVDLPVDEPEEHGENTSWMYEASVFVADWHGESCVVTALGQRVSTVRLKSGTAEVYTRDLSWETTAPEKQRLCVVNTTNPARLHKSPKDGSAIINRCMPGTVVPVYEVKKGWVRVQYQDANGWIKKKSVDFLDADKAPGYRFGYVSCKGKYTRGATVKLRRNPSTGSRALDELSTGQRLVVLEPTEDGKWYRVDAGSLQGYIQTEYVSFPDRADWDSVPRRGTTAETFYTLETAETEEVHYVKASAGEVGSEDIMTENPLDAGESAVNE